MSVQTFRLPKTGRERLADNLRSFVMSVLPGKEIRVEVCEYRKPRSTPQCRYLNGVAYKALGEATGYERDDISEYLCGTFFGWKDKKYPGGTVRQVPLRTTTTDEEGKRRVMSTVEFSEYVEFVQRFGSKHGIYIPSPDEEFT